MAGWKRGILDIALVEVGKLLRKAGSVSKGGP